MARPLFSLGVLALFVTFTSINGLNVEYCSPDNTATTNGNYSMYQSNGLCYEFCLPEYAFAVLQGSNCYCANLVPSATTSSSDCSETCSGYPDDLCGNSAEGLFGYIALARAPSGTAGASSSAPASTPSSTPQPTVAPVTVTETPAPQTVLVTPTPPSSSSTSSTSSNTPTPSTKTPTTSSSSTSTTTSSTPTTMWTPTPVTSLETVTGQVRTVTVTPTVPPNSQNLTPVNKSSSGGGSGGISTGGAVGLTIGLVALVAIISAMAYFCIKKRQKDRAAEEMQEGSRRGSSAGLGGPVPSRTMSENSRYVLGTDGRQVVEAWEPETRDAPGSRRSRLVPVDPRLDPFAAVYQRGENRSRESVNTLRDDQDYSRRINQPPVLRAMNPDT